MKANSSLKRRFSIVAFAFPLTMSVAIGFMHYVSHSFFVYLKYQALVDSYYHRHVIKQQTTDAPSSETEQV